MSGVTTAENSAQSGSLLTIEGKQFGRGNKSLFPNFQMPVPVEWHGSAITLRTLIEAVVRSKVAAFQERQENSTVLQALSAAQIAEGVAKGKVDSGGSSNTPVEVDADETVQTALQAFEDSLYFVFVDNIQRESLSDALLIGTGTHVTFLRLVAMAGG